MSNRPLYQILYQNDIELVLQGTTLETATDVTYNEEQFQDAFNNGTISSTWERVEGYWYSSSTDFRNKIYFINMAELIRQVGQQLEKNKEVAIDLPEKVLEKFRDYHSYRARFKEHGFMFRPTKDVFVRYKAKSKKKVVSKALINDMRNMFMEAVCHHIQTKHGFHFKYVSCCNKKDQAAIVKFGLENGYTWNEVTTVAFQTWNEYNSQTYKYEPKGRPLMAYLQHRLSEEPKLIQQTFDEFKKWYDESLK